MIYLEKYTSSNKYFKRFLVMWHSGIFDKNTNFFNQIVFSGEAIFMLNGVINRHRYGASRKSSWMPETRTQYILTGVVTTTLLGPFLLTEIWQQWSYLRLLPDQIVPSIIINTVGSNFQHTWFQQDDAPHILNDMYECIVYFECVLMNV